MKIRIADKTNQRRIKRIRDFLSNNQIFLDNLRVRINDNTEKRNWIKIMKKYQEVFYEINELYHENKDKL